MRIDLQIIGDWVEPQARVLDLACGDGALLRSLMDQRAVTGYGLENDPQSISACIEKGVRVIEKNLVRDLDGFADKSFDTVIMTQAIQVMRYPDVILEEMLRVGHRCIVTFPNFGNVVPRTYLALRGRMPVTRKLPYQWYDTPNIHFCTVTDFKELCKTKGYLILDERMLAERGLNRLLKNIWPNLFAETAVYHLTKP